MKKLGSEELSNLTVPAPLGSSRSRTFHHCLVRALINCTPPNTCLVPSQPVTAENHSVMPTMGPRQPLILVGDSCVPSDQSWGWQLVAVWGQLTAYLDGSRGCSSSDRLEQLESPEADQTPGSFCLHPTRSPDPSLTSGQECKESTMCLSI